jgi:hypothetical protein
MCERTAILTLQAVTVFRFSSILQQNFSLELLYDQDNKNKFSTSRNHASE